jgi:hypothetical protein
MEMAIAAYEIVTDIARGLGPYVGHKPFAAPHGIAIGIGGSI